MVSPSCFRMRCCGLETTPLQIIYYSLLVKNWRRLMRFIWLLDIMITESLNRPHVAASWHCLTISPGFVFIALITWMVLRMRLSACGIVQDRSCSSSERLLSSSRTSYIKATFSRNSIDSIRLTSPVYFALSSFWKFFCKWLLASERQGSALALFPENRSTGAPPCRALAQLHHWVLVLNWKFLVLVLVLTVSLLLLP